MSCICMFTYSQTGMRRKFEVTKKLDRIYPSKYLIPYIKYIENRPELSSGIPDISVGLSNGTSLRYNATGIMVNEQPSYVGLGWFLDVGGVVTRVVKGLPDELKDKGYIDCKKNYTSEKISNIGENDLKSIDSETYDTEQDMFYFYTKDFMGKFVVDSDSTGHTIPASNIRIEIAKGAIGNRLDEIRIIPPGGDIYVFRVGETVDISNISGGSNTVCKTGWMLNTIKSHSNDAAKTEIRYVKIESEYNIKMDKYRYSNQDGIPVTVDHEYKCKYTSYVLPLVVSSYGSYSVFTYNDMNEDYYKLKNLPPHVYNWTDYEVQNSAGATLKSISTYDRGLHSGHRFVYKERMDHAGNTLLLDSVINEKLHKDTRIVLKAFGFDYSDFNFDGVPINSQIIGEDLWGYPSINISKDVLSKASLNGRLLDPLDYTSIVCNGPYMLTDDNRITGRMLYKIEDKLSGNIQKYVFEPNQFMYKGNVITGGGVRIKSQHYYNKSEPNKEQKIEYKYLKKGSNETSGELISYPYVGEKILNYPFTGDNYFHYGTYHNGLHSEGIRPVQYSTVTVSKPGKGSEEFNYITHPVQTPEYNKQNKFGNSEETVSIYLSSINYGSGVIHRGGDYYSSLYTNEKIKSAGSVEARSTMTYTRTVKDHRCIGFRKRFNANWAESELMDLEGNIVGGTFGTVSSIAFYDNIASEYSLKTMKDEVVNNSNSIASTTVFDYLKDGYHLPFRKSVLLPDGTRKVEETYYSGSYSGGDNSGYKKAKKQLDKKLFAMQSSDMFNAENRTWDTDMQLLIPDSKQPYYNILYSYATNIEAKEILELQTRNNLFTPIEKISYVVYPNQDSILLEAKLHRLKTIEASNSVVIDKTYVLRGPILWTGNSYVKSHVDKNNHFIYDYSNLKKVASFMYNNYGSVKESIGEDGLISSYLYDDRQNVIAKAKGVKYPVIYQKRQELINGEYPFVDSDGLINCFYYNSDSRKVKEADVTGNFTYYDYNILGNVATIYDNNMNIVSHTKSTIHGKNIPLYNTWNNSSEAEFTIDNNIYPVLLSNIIKLKPNQFAYCNGTLYSKDFYFNSVGEKEVMFYMKEGEKLIASEKRRYSVTKREFVETVGLFKYIIQPNGEGSYYKESLQKNYPYFVSCRFAHYGYMILMNEYPLAHGSGRYVVKTALVKCESPSLDCDVSKPEYRTQEFNSYNKKAKILQKIEGEGNYILYVWVYDKLDTPNMPDKPDLSTAKYTYKFVVKYQSDELPNPVK